MTEEQQKSLLDKYEDRITNLVWTLLKNNKVNTGVYLLIFLCDFIYKLILMLEIFSEQGCLPFTITALSSLYSEDQIASLSIASVTLSVFIFTLIAVLVGILFSKQKLLRRQEYLHQQSSSIMQVLSFILILIKVCAFTLIFYTLLNQVIISEEGETIFMNKLAFYLSIFGLITLVLLQYLMAIFFNFILLHEHLPFAETSYKTHINEMLFKMILAVAHMFKDKNQILFSLAAAMLLLQVYQLYIRLMKSFVIHELVHKIHMLDTFLFLYLPLLLLISPIFSEKTFYAYFMLAFLPAPIIIWVYVTSLRRVKLINVLNSMGSLSQHETVIALLTLVDKLEQSKKNEDKIWINCLEDLHTAICPDYYLMKQKELLKAHEEVSIQKEDEEKLIEERSPEKVQEMTFAQRNDEQMNQCRAEALHLESQLKKRKEGMWGSGKIMQRFLQITDHIFNQHVLVDHQTHFHIALIQLWYVQRVRENPYLTLFLVLILKERNKDRSFVENFMVRVVFSYIVELVGKQFLYLQSFKDIDIQHILTVDEMSSKFDFKMASVTAQIESFWKQLLSDNQDGSTFKNGIHLAVDMKKLERLCAEIQNEYPTKKNNQVYIKMTQFNRVVLSKADDAMNLSALGYDNLKTLYLKDLDQQKEKGLLVVNCHLKQSMPVIFVNNFMMKLVGTNRDDFLNKPVNQIMPSVVSENHSRFLDHYVRTWKPKMTNSRSQLFIKDRNNYLLSVFLQTQPNIVNTNQVVLILETDQNFNPFEDSEHKNICYMIVDEALAVREISKTFGRITGIDYEVLKGYSERFERTLKLEDIVQVSNPSSNQPLNDVFRELQENFLYKAYFRDYNITNDRIHAVITQDTFSMIVTPYTFMKKQIKMLVISFQLQQDLNLLGSQRELALSTSKPTTDLPHEGSVDEGTGAQHSSLQYSSVSHSQGNVSSQSSSSGRFTSTLQNRSLEFTNIINKTSTPLTLTFINQISLIVLLIILISSAITLALILRSQDNASTGIIVNNIALKRINGFSQSRTLLRLLGNIANGYIENTSDLIQNRFQYYLPLFEQAIKQMSENNIQLRQYEVDSPMLSHLLYSSITMLQKNLTTIKYNFTTEYAVNQYTNAGFETHQKISEMGQTYLQSDLDFMQIQPSNRTEATLDERNYFIILQQAKDNLYFQTRTYSQNFILYEKQEISDKAQYTKVLTFVCIALIGVSAIALIPFFMKVQKRISQLLEIFFTYDKASISQILLRIKQFKSFLEAQKNITSKSKKETVNLEVVPPQSRVHAAPSTRNNNESTRRNFVEMKDSKRKLREQEEEKEEDQSEEEEKVDVEKKKRDKGKIKLNLQEAFDQNNLQKNITQRHLNQYLNKRNACQVALIVMLAIVASFFFLIQYIQSLRSFEEMSSSIKSMNDIGLKSFITGGLIYSIMENHLMNVTTKAVNNEGLKMSMALFLVGEFEEYESDYVVRVIKEQSKHLGGALEYINILESDRFCQLVFGNNSQSQTYKENSEYWQESVPGVYTPLNVEQCEEMAIANQGLDAIFTRLYVQSQQLIITYDSAKESFNRTEEFLRHTIKEDLAKMGDVYFVFCCNQVSVMLNLAYEGIISYFDKVTKQFVLIYICFLLTMVMVVLFMKLSVLRRLRNEMHLSNKLLYIIDFESQSDTEQQRILKFLKEY